MKIIEYLLHQYRAARYPQYRANNSAEAAYRKLLKAPRYTIGEVELLGKPLKFVDGPSCYFIHKEIFKEEIYKFETDVHAPYILDAGANIGLGIIYLKQIFPQAHVVGFEPDKKVFEVLRENVNTFALQNVTLVSKALWNEETTLKFFDEGADAGRVSSTQDKDNLVEVEAISLRPYLKERKVDFLKVDIEGAETTVLRDCTDLLGNVERIFVEYHSFVGHEQTLPEVLGILKGAGFRLSISAPGLTSKSPLMKRETYAGMDMQLNIYGFRD